MIGKIVVLTRAIMEWLVCSAHNRLPWFSGSKINQSETLLYHDSAHGILRVPQMPLILGQFGGWKALLYICDILYREGDFSTLFHIFLQQPNFIPGALPCPHQKASQNTLNLPKTILKPLLIHSTATQTLISFPFLLIHSREEEKQPLHIRFHFWSDQNLIPLSLGYNL